MNFCCMVHILLNMDRVLYISKYTLGIGNFTCMVFLSTNWGCSRANLSNYRCQTIFLVAEVISATDFDFQLDGSSTESKLKGWAILILSFVMSIFFLLQLVSSRLLDSLCKSSSALSWDLVFGLLWGVGIESGVTLLIWILSGLESLCDCLDSVLDSYLRFLLRCY